MKKTIICVLLSCICLPLVSCEQKYNNQKYDILDITFESGYYKMVGEEGLRANSAVQQPEYMAWQHSALNKIAVTDNAYKFIFKVPDKQGLLCYDKLTGEINCACPKTDCEHYDCLFNGEYKVIGGVDKLFFPVNRKYIMTDYNGNNQTKTDIPSDAEFSLINEKGVYYNIVIYKYGKEYSSLYFYDFEKGESTPLVYEQEGIGSATVVSEDEIYFGNRRLNIDNTLKAPFEYPEGAIYRWNCNLYLEDYKTNTIDLYKIQDEKYTVLLKDFPRVNLLAISGDYMYYTLCEADNASSGDKELDAYIANYCPSEGKLYRRSLENGKTECVLELSTDGIPDCVYSIYTDGQMLYIQCMDYKNFENNYNKTSGNM